MKIDKLLATKAWAVGLIVLPLLAIAGEELLGKSEMSSRFGQLKVLNTGDQQQLFIGKKSMPIKDHFVSIEKIWQIASKDVFLISMASGGSACPATYAFIVLESKVASLSDSFGNCSDLPNVERLGNRIVVKFGRRSRDNPAVVVELDDLSVFEGKKKLKVMPVAF